MFLFTDPSLLDAVIAAKRRGVHVRVMLNPARRDGSSDNDAARKALLAAGVSVRNSSAAFAVTHQKSMVIDNKVGFIRSLNWETRSDGDPRLRRRERPSRPKWPRWSGVSTPIGNSSHLCLHAAPA